VCGPKSPPLEDLRAADAVFEGRVISNARVEVRVAENVSLPERRVRFDVTRAWKGGVADVVELRTGISSGMCGKRFDVQTIYLVYAYRRHDGNLHTGLCTRTARITDAGEDLIALGPEREQDGAAGGRGRLSPAPPPVEPASRAGCRGCSSGAVSHPAFALFIVVVCARARESARKHRRPPRRAKFFAVVVLGAAGSCWTSARRAERAVKAREPIRSSTTRPS
jgi:hypothetical protein